MIQRGRVAVPLGRHPVHQGAVHVPEALERGGLRGDVGHLPGGPRGLGLLDQRVVMEGVEEVAQRIRRGKLPIQEAAEPAIGLEHGDVVETGAPGREQEDQGLDLLDLAVPALALADVDVLGDRLVEPEGAQRLEDEGQPGAAGQSSCVRDHFHRVREEPLAHRVGRRRGARPRGGGPCRRARFTAVSALTMVQSSS